MSIRDFSQVNSFLSSGGGISKEEFDTLRKQVSEIDLRMIPAKVVDVCLNSNSNLYQTLGNEWTNIGTIQFQLLDQPTQNQENVNNTFSNKALPLFPQFKNYPLVNEIVLLVQLPGNGNTQFNQQYPYYYLNSINIWNAPSANPYPNVYSYNETSDSQDKSYEQIEAGNTRKTSNEEKTLNLNGFSGGTFTEPDSVNPMLPFAGDNIIEGRFGNTIRLGNSSSPNGGKQNNWSGGSTDGSPLIIIKNGQAETTEASWVPVTENINEDQSSIYLTSNQKIPISSSILQQNVETLNTAPFGDIIKGSVISPNLYNQPQIILNSGRLLFNTTIDNIIMTAKKNIILESVEDIGIKSRDKNINIFSEKGVVNIGRIDSKEAAILGSTFMARFNELVEAIIRINTALATSPDAAAIAAEMEKESLNNIQAAVTGSRVLSNFVKLS